VIALAAHVIVTAPQFLYQLLTHYADVPLAIFVAAGVAAGGTWLVTDGVDAWALVCLVAFLGMATLTKNEGLLYAAACLAALIAAAATVGRARVRRATVAAAAVLAIALPWRVYTILLDLRPTDYDLSNAFRPSYLRDHADRLDTVVPELWRQIVTTGHWGYVVPIVLLALISGATSSRWRISLYAAVWLAASFGGLLITYWVSVLPVESNLSNSSYRTIVSLIAGGIAVTPLLLFPRTEEDRAVLATGAHLALRPAEEEAQPEPPATGHKSPGTGR
jgi:4-amino-4-deoxy-L-arabinose transferase-like glycosyltransferase